MKTAICLFGVNGVGKSSVLSSFRMLHPDTVVLHGSSILKEFLGVASYKELESKSARDKKLAYIQGLKSALRSVTSGTVIVDTHLVVTIWGAEGRHLEDMWDEALKDIFDGFVYMTSSPAIVSERRERDLASNSRVRQCDELCCRSDLADNDSRWDTVSAQCQKACVIVNDTALELATKKLLDFVHQLQHK